jgi:hypothetical protein
MRRSFTLLSALLMLVLAAGAVYAPPFGGRGRGGPGPGWGPGWGQDTIDESTLTFVEGTVKTATMDREKYTCKIVLTRKTKEGKEQQATLMANFNTKVSVGDDAGFLTDITPGSTVMVGYVPPKNDSVPIAAVVRITKAGTDAKPEDKPDTPKKTGD